MTGIWPGAWISLDYCWRWGQGLVCPALTAKEKPTISETQAAVFVAGGISFVMFPNQFSK